MEIVDFMIPMPCAKAKRILSKRTLVRSRTVDQVSGPTEDPALNLRGRIPHNFARKPADA